MGACRRRGARASERRCPAGARVGAEGATRRAGLDNVTGRDGHGWGKRRRAAEPAAVSFSSYVEVEAPLGHAKSGSEAAPNTEAPPDAITVPAPVDWSIVSN